MPEVPDELQVRRERLIALRARAIDPYPSITQRTHTIEHVAAQFTDLASRRVIVTIAGRVRAIRRHGGAAFVPVADGTGSLQLYFTKDHLGEKVFELLEYLDTGDFIEASGTLFVTKRGERSLLASSFSMLAKSLRPLPEKWHGLVDVEIRYRKRYLDLLANEAVRSNALRRTVIMKTLRSFLDERGFVEVETPMLQAIPGGATARPFITHLNALNIDLYLRVAPELYLKRLLVGGLPKIYEVGRCFRNEGIDHAHNPEFTQVEIYEAYVDYEQLRQRLEELLTVVVLATTGSLAVPYEGQTIDFTPPYTVNDWVEVLETALGYRIEGLDDESLRQQLIKSGVSLEKTDGRGAMLDLAYKKFVRPHLMQPTFLIDHPLCLSPLAKRHRSKADRAERFQLVLGGGVELMNGFSELNDPIDQAGRFWQQERLRRAGDEEAQWFDQDYIEALEHGMPPAAGVGIGLDRLTAVLTNNHSLKEVILFPTLRPKDG